MKEKHLISDIQITIHCDDKYFYRSVKSGNEQVYRDQILMDNYIKVNDLIQQVDAYFCLPPQANHSCNSTNNCRKGSRFFRKLRAKALQLQIQFFKIFR